MMEIFNSLKGQGELSISMCELMKICPKVGSNGEDCVDVKVRGEHQ